jgi:hypothetical protein
MSISSEKRKDAQKHTQQRERRKEDEKAKFCIGNQYDHIVWADNILRSLI